MNFLAILTSIFQIVFWFIVILVPLVIIHELGHLIFARLFGVKIPEFGVGMPLTNHKISKKWRGINWSIYPWLLGGFVRIFGDHDPLDEAYELAKSNETLAKKEYIPARFFELISTFALEDFLIENSIDYDSNMKWFEIVSSKYNGDKNPDLKNYLSALKKLQIGDKPKFISKLADFNIDNIDQIISTLDINKSQILSEFFEKQWCALKSTIETLIDWEFDAKITSGNKKAIKNAFFAKNWIQQTLIISGGVIFNMMAAFLLLIISFSTVGTIPEIYTLERKPVLQNQIDAYQNSSKLDILSKGLNVTLSQDSALKKAGISSGDELLRIRDASNPDNEFEFEKSRPKDLIELRSKMNNFKGKEVVVEYLKNSDKTVSTTKLTFDLNKDKDQVVLNAMIGYKVKRYGNNFGNSINLAWNETWKIFGLTFDGIKDLVVALFPQTTDRTALASVTGPIGIGYASSSVFNATGFAGIIYLMAIVSVALAVFNMLPIPALDGGRFVMLTLSKIFGKRNRKIETIAISFTFILLILLAVLVAGLDVQKIIK